jgi:hypothetical protein
MSLETASVALDTTCRKKRLLQAPETQLLSRHSSGQFVTLAQRLVMTGTEMTKYILMGLLDFSDLPDLSDLLYMQIYCWETGCQIYAPVALSPEKESKVPIR